MGRQSNHSFHITERTKRLRKAKRRSVRLGPAATNTPTSIKTGGLVLPRDDVYKNLETARDAFRLLKLYPGSEGSPIRCKLFNARVSRWKQKYTAGSYVWGPKKHRKAIFVNKRRFLVTENLRAFLAACRLQIKSESLILWIDAICINQKSESERKHQVQIMKLIYENAKCAYSWLGHAHSDSDWLFDTLNDARLGAVAWAVSPISTLPPQYVHRRRLAFNRSGYILSKRLFTAIAALTTRPYWTRIWILQEVVLSAEVIMICGTRQLNWDHLPITPLEDRDANDQGLCSRDINTISKSLMCQMYHERRNFLFRIPTTNFDSLYRRFMSLKSSFWHDSIFGLLGLAQAMDNQKHILQIDYSMSRVGLILAVLKTFKIGSPFDMTVVTLRNLKVSQTEILHWLNKTSTDVKFNQTSAFEECHRIFRSFYWVQIDDSYLNLYDCYFTPLHLSRIGPELFTCWYFTANSAPVSRDSLIQLGNTYWSPYLIIRADQSLIPRIVGVTIRAEAMHFSDVKEHSLQLYLQLVRELVEKTNVALCRDIREAHKLWSLTIDFNSLLRLAAFLNTPWATRTKQTARPQRDTRHDIHQRIDRSIRNHLDAFPPFRMTEQESRYNARMRRIEQELRY
jgi:Heterokaryon incompatibility protein (HET)